LNRRKSRDILGANGIVDDTASCANEQPRSVYTYEGHTTFHKLYREKITGFSVIV